MRDAQFIRERSMAHRIDEEAHEIIVSCQKWRPRIIEFSNPYTDLTPEEEDFIAKRISQWELEIIGRNGLETVHRPSHRGRGYIS